MHVYDSVRRCIQQAGGDVYLIVPVQNVDYLRISNSKIPKMTLEEEKKMENVLDMCDGLFLPGGSKFTEYDRFILDYAIKKDIPTLDVCLSMQMMSCYKEEINLVKNDSTINHYQRGEDIFCHSILINENSKLYKILGKRKIMVNSLHNYHVTENHIYKTVARSVDGVIEAIEHPTCTFNIGVQWHPERDYGIDENSKLIIDNLIKEAIKYKKTRKNYSISNEDLSIKM